MISVILYGRNDSHGYNLHKRAAISLNCIAEVLTHENDEIIFVDCNTPDDMPTFPEAIHDTLTEKAKRLIRIFRLRPDLYEKNRKGSHLNALEPLSRNIAIRRSNPKNRWILSTNTDMIFIPRIEGKSLSDIAAKIPNGFYELPRYEVPEALWESVDRSKPLQVIELFAHWGQRLHINNAVVSNKYIRYDGPGDFQLILRKQAFSINGFDEEMVLGWHLDSNIAKRLYLLNGKTESLLNKVFAYHCDHTRQATLMHGPKRKQNDLKRFVEDVKSPYLPDQAKQWGLPDEEIEEIHLNNKFINRFAELLYSTIPGLSVSYTKDMFGSDKYYNHGLLYDNNHVIPYLTDHFCSFKPNWNYSYFGSNIDLLKNTGEIRLKLNHSGKILYYKELFEFAGIKDFSQLPDNCEPADLNTIKVKSDIFIFDAGLNSFPSEKDEEGVSFPIGSKRLLFYLITFYTRFIKITLFENQYIKHKKNTARKFLLIASQCTWFEAVSVQVIGVLFAPFSGRVRTGFLREDAFNYPLFPPSLESFFSTTEILEDLSVLTNRNVTLIEYYAAGTRLQTWISLYKDEGAFAKALLGLPVTEVDFALLKCRSQICQLVGQQQLSKLFENMYTILSKVYPEPAKKMEVYLPYGFVLNSDDIQEFYELTNVSDKTIPVQNKLNIILHAPLYDPSGYADASRNILFGLDNAGIKVSAVPINWSKSVANLSSNEEQKLKRLSQLPENTTDKVVNIFNIFPPFYKRTTYGNYHIGRTMFETDRIPDEWVKCCNEMDEIWVPSKFNLDTFTLAGVKKDKIKIIPEGIEISRFDSDASPLQIKGKRKFNFLSVFDWSLRKGWDVLLRGFIEEFPEDSDISLTLKVWSSGGKKLTEIKEEAQKFIIKNSIGNKIPGNIIFLEQNLDAYEFSGLYKSADCFVLPTRGEGWGRPFMEAMLMNVPVIGTRWSGQLEFMNDNNSFLIDCSEVEVSQSASKETPAFKGHKWAEPSLSHLKFLMRYVVVNRNNIKEKTEAAQSDIKNKFNSAAVTKIILERLSQVERNLNSLETGSTHKSDGKAQPQENNEVINIKWEGPQFNYSSLALINREHSKRLINDGFNLSLLTRAPLNSADFNLPSLKNIINKNIGRTHFHVAHQFPPDLQKPPDGKWIIMQPWEFGSLPEKWVEVFTNQADEIWVPSNYVRKVCMESGVPAGKIFVIPNGINPDVFNKSVKPYKLNTKRKFKFLFVGGTIYRKGIDILLEVYTKNFNSSDDVCLVIKDMGGDSFYTAQNFKEKILEISKKEGAPEIEYIDSILSNEEMAGLYKACNVLVHPYRGEGFGLPVLEAMACGLPPIVTAGGSCDDFCNPENSVLIKSEKVLYKNKLVGDLETVGHPWLLEPSPDELRNKMLGAYQNQIDLSALGDNASNFAQLNFTWEHAYNKLKQRLYNLFYYTDLKNTIPSNPETDSMKEIEKAETLIGENKLKEAAKILEEILNADNCNLNAMNDMSVIKIMEENYPEGIDLIEKILKVDPANEIALENLKYIEQQMGEYKGIGNAGKTV